MAGQGPRFRWMANLVCARLADAVVGEAAGAAAFESFGVVAPAGGADDVGAAERRAELLVLSLLRYQTLHRSC